MPVSISTKSGSTNDLLQKLGTVLGLEAEAAAIASAGYGVFMRPKRLVVAENEKADGLATLQINTDLIPLLVADKVVPDSKGTLKEKIGSLFHDAINQLGLDVGDFGASAGAAIPVNDTEEEDVPNKAKKGAAKKKTAISDVAVPVADVVEKPVMPASQVTAVGYYEGNATLDEPVKLAKATALHQPVRGSSADSRYFVVAMDDNVKVAARLKASGESGPMAVSIRVEGAGLDDVDANLKALGFKRSGEYASIHVNSDGGGKLLALKSLGALVSCIGVAGVMSPAAAWLVNKGS